MRFCAQPRLRTFYFQKEGMTMKKAISLLLALALSLSVLPFSVLAEDPSASSSPGLRFKWAYYDEDDTLVEEDTFKDSLGSHQLGYSNEFTVYFVSGDATTLLSPDVLEFEGSCCEMTATGSVLCLNYIATGDGAVVYQTNGAEYRLPVTVTLPRVALYSSKERSEDTYVGDELSFTGNDDVYYILPADDWTISEIDDSNCDFITCEIAEDGNYAMLKLSENFNTDTRYRIGVALTREDGDSTYDTSLRFFVTDARPGLRFKYSDSELMSAFSSEIDTSHDIAVYYVDGDNQTPISPNDLEFPSLVAANHVFEEGDREYEELDKVGFMLECLAFGTGAITYTKGDTTYELPVTVTLPDVGFYSAPTASEEAYLGRRLTYTGKDDVFYILPEDGWKIADLAPVSDNMDFFSFVLADDGSSVTVTLSDGFTDEWYRIRLTLTSTTNSNNYYSTRIGFDIADSSPGLRFKRAYYDENGELIENNNFRSSLNDELGSGDQFNLYFVENGIATPVSVNELGKEGDCFEFHARREGSIVTNYTHVGTGAITYTKDGITYKLPVTVTLPVAGLYSTTTASEATYLNGVLSAMPGETATAYLLWDESFGELEDYTVDLRTDGNWTDITDDLSAYGLSITESGKNYCKVEAVTGEAQYFRMNLSLENNSCSAWFDVLNTIDAKDREWRQYDETPTFTYNGHTYSFSIGELEESGRFHLYGGGGAFGNFDDTASYYCEEVLHLGAIMDLDTADEQAAPSWVLECISNVSFTIEDWLNLPLTGDQTSSNLSLAPAELDTESHMYYTVFSAEPECCGYALLRIDFTVTFPGQAPVDCTVRLAGHRTCVPLIRAVIGDDIDTAAELNAIFSSKNAFLTYWQENQPDTYREYISTKASGLDYIFEIDLPAVVYDDVIELNCDDLGWPMIYATTSDESVTTTLPGLRINHFNDCTLNGFNFVANPNATQCYDGDTFTCGVFAYSDDPNYYGDANINWCTFTGFDYGVRCTAGSYVSASGNNVFDNCKIGCYLDCSNKYNGIGNDRISRAIFRNCGTAIKLTGLPNYISAYAFRVFCCDFIDNDLDFDVQQAGNFYFYRNFYGTFDGKDSTVATNARPLPVTIKEGTNTRVYTNPRYAFPLMTGDDTEDYNYYLYLDAEYDTAILNSQADDLELDYDALTETLRSATTPLSIQVLGDDEEVQGTWTFNGTED